MRSTSLPCAYSTAIRADTGTLSGTLRSANNLAETSLFTLFASMRRMWRRSPRASKNDAATSPQELLLGKAGKEVRIEVNDRPTRAGARALRLESLNLDFDTRGQIGEGIGVTPDVVVDLRPDLVAAGRDPQLERAVAEIMTRLKK